MSPIRVPRSLRLSQPILGSRLVLGSPRAPPLYIHTSAARPAAANLNPNTISAITEREKHITGEDGPVADGPTAHAQKYAGQPLTQAIISDIMKSEQTLTGLTGPISGGPAALLQKIFDAVGGNKQEYHVLSCLLTYHTNRPPRAQGSTRAC